MATLDFTPLFRSSVGFDVLPELLSDAVGRAESTHLPRNIEKCGEDQYPHCHRPCRLRQG
jgi:molecular chaperone IbpA